MKLKTKHIKLFIIVGLLIVCSFIVIALFIQQNKQSLNSEESSFTVTEENTETKAGDNTTLSDNTNEMTNNSPETTIAPETTAKTEEETTGIPSDTTIVVEETTKSPVTKPEPVDTSEPKPVHTHSYTDTVISPTCAENGYTLHSCACGYSYKDQPTWKLGHLYTTWYTVKEATISETGLQECKCDTCGSAPIYKELPKRPAGNDIDSRVKIENVYGKIKYSYGSCSVMDRRTWGNVLKISVASHGGLRVTYDNQSGEIIEFDVIIPPENYRNAGVIENNGTYFTQIIGAHS